MDVREELQEFLKTQQSLGCKRRDIALVLFARGYTEKQVGLVMGINPKSAHAMKVDFSKKGKEAREKQGKPVHLDASTANLKRVGGKKQMTRLITLVDAFLAQDGKEQPNA
jgi:hypothetical protein